MPRDKRTILKEDIMPIDIYKNQRKELRKKFLNLKKIEEFHLGPMLHFILKVLKQC